MRVECLETIRCAPEYMDAFFCVLTPQVTGHNCAGAVLYPITIGDFVMADMTDDALDGVVAAFPSYYRRHVGRTEGRRSQGTQYSWHTWNDCIQTPLTKDVLNRTCQCNARAHSPYGFRLSHKHSPNTNYYKIPGLYHSAGEARRGALSWKGTNVLKMYSYHI